MASNQLEDKQANSECYNCGTETKPFEDKMMCPNCFCYTTRTDLQPSDPAETTEVANAPSHPSKTITIESIDTELMDILAMASTVHISASNTQWWRDYVRKFEQTTSAKDLLERLRALITETRLDELQRLIDIREEDIANGTLTKTATIRVKGVKQRIKDLKNDHHTYSLEFCHPCDAAYRTYVCMFGKELSNISKGGNDG